MQLAALLLALPFAAWALEVLAYSDRVYIARNQTTYLTDTPYSNRTKDSLSLSYYANRQKESETFLSVQLSHVQDVHLVDLPKSDSVGQNVVVSRWVYNLTGLVLVNDDSLVLTAFNHSLKTLYEDWNSNGRKIQKDEFETQMALTALNETHFHINGSVINTSLNNLVVSQFSEVRLLATLRSDNLPGSTQKESPSKGKEGSQPGKEDHSDDSDKEDHSDDSDKEDDSDDEFLDGKFTHPVFTLVAVGIILAGAFFFFNHQRRNMLNRAMMAMRGNKSGFRRTSEDYDISHGTTDDEEGMEMFRISSDREEDERRMV